MSSASGRLRPGERIELGDYPVDAAWSGDGRLLVVGGGEGAVLLLASAAGSSPRSIGRHEGGVLAVTWQSAGGLFASSGQDGVVSLWDARSLEAKPIHRGREWSEQLAFADHGRWLAVATGRALHLFDPQGEAHHRFADHAGAIAALAWRPGSPEIAAAGNGGVRLHRLEPQPQSRDYPWRGACLTASWKADGRALACGMQDGSVQLWNIASGTRTALPGLGAKVFATGWSASGRFLATAAGHELVVWDRSGKAADAAQPTRLTAHSERITALAVRPTGSALVSAARDRRLLLWRIGTANEPQDAHLLREDCTLLRFSRDGTRLAVGDAGGGMTIYDCTP
jgi:WD40 repeat protein